MSSVGRRFSFHMTDTTERSGFVYMHKLLKQLLILLLCTVWSEQVLHPLRSLQPRPVTISSCKISGKSKVRVTAVTANPRKISGSRCYLFALTPGMSARPVASCKKSKKMTFTCKLNSGGVNLLEFRFCCRFGIPEGNIPISAHADLFPTPVHWPNIDIVFQSPSPKRDFRSMLTWWKMRKNWMYEILWSILISVSWSHHRHFKIPGTLTPGNTRDKLTGL